MEGSTNPQIGDKAIILTYVQLVSFCGLLTVSFAATLTGCWCKVGGDR